MSAFSPVSARLNGSSPTPNPAWSPWRSGIGSVDVMCPGFVSDCLETLEEINMECRRPSFTLEVSTSAIFPA
jgi:hypothetical protein